MADRQTGGRGRRGRHWETWPGNLAASCHLRRDRLAGGAPAELGFVVSLALYDACVPHVGAARLALKWPNDLLGDGAKLSGILLELEPEYLIVGVGVNLAVAPAIEGRTTTSLSALGADVAVADFLEQLAACFATWLDRWQTEGFGRVGEEWLQRAHPVGTRLVATLHGERRAGRFAGLAADGALLFEADGVRHVIHAADIWVEEE